MKYGALLGLLGLSSGMKIRESQKDVYWGPSGDHTQPHTTTMQPGKCIVFRNGQSGDNGNYDFVLTTVEIDGVRTLAAEHYQVDDKDQEWFWNESDGSIYNNAFPDFYITTDGDDRQMTLQRKKGGKASDAQSHFDYQKDQILTGDRYAFTIDHDTQYVSYQPNVGGTAQSWHIQYCKGEEKVKSPEEMGYTTGWTGKYWFFPHYTGWNGYDTTGKTPNIEKKVNYIYFWWDSYFRWFVQRNFQTDRFQAEWTAHFLVNHPGEYTFSTMSDDGSRLWVDNAQVVENWGLHGRRKRTGTKVMGQGWHDVRVLFYENGGGANCVVRWKGPDTNGWERYLGGYS